MSKIKTLEDNKDLVETKNFPYGKFSFSHFNPPQSRVFEYYDKDINCLIDSTVGTGKTEMCEMFCAHEIRKNNNKILYLSPSKALSQEKLDDWSDASHHFGDLNISICTGDYVFTAARQKELENADIVIMTYEMLNSCSRQNSSKRKFLEKVNTLVIDEFHYVGEGDRGSHLECGLINFTRFNETCRIVGLSGTFFNAEEVAGWLSKLNNKDTIVIKSTYRPVPLNIHYNDYNDYGYYDQVERNKVNAALDLVRNYKQDKFLIFAHTKKTGELMKNTLLQKGINCEFHNANLDKKKRLNITERFIKDPGFRVVVATSTVGAGVNLPARRVIVLGMHRGLSEVSNRECFQMAGRSGRPQYDPCGDAYILLPKSKIQDCIKKLKKPQPVQSQLLGETEEDHNILAFHIINEINVGNIKTEQDIIDWYSVTLAAHQQKDLSQDIIKKLIKSLLSCRAIFVDEDGTYNVTNIGKIASLFYYSPYDIADLYQNFDKIFEKHKEHDDIWISMALGDIATYKKWIVSKDELELIKEYKEDVYTHKALGKKYDHFCANAAMKAGFCYHALLTGGHACILGAVVNGLRTDLGRTMEVLNAINGMVGKWDNKEFFDKLRFRLTYGVKEELMEVCQIEGIGGIKGQKLYDHGLKTLKDLANNKNRIIEILHCTEKFAKKISENAALLLKGQ